MSATFDQLVYETLPRVTGCAVYPGEADPAAALPYLVQDEAAQEQLSTIQGAVYLDIWTLTLEVYAATRAEARRLASAARDALVALRGDYLGGALTVRRVSLDDEEAGVLGHDHGEDAGTHVVTLSFKAQFTAA